MLRWQQMNALLRVLIPSWRFFDDVGHVSKLFYQTNLATQWQPCFQPQPRHWYQLFLNPQTNLRMALNSLVERLVSEISEATEASKDQIPQSVSYQLVENLVRHQARSQNVNIKTFRFKIIVSDPAADTESARAGEEVLLSDLCEV